MTITAMNSAMINASSANWLARGQEYLSHEKFADALDALQHAAVAMPLNGEVYRLQALAYHANGQQTEALAAGMAVAALEERSAIALFNIGTTYFMNQHFEPAAKWYRLALMLDPDLVEANQNIALILHREGRLAEAGMHYDRAYRQQSLFIEPATIPMRNILILCAGRPGNVPFDYLLPQTKNTRIKWVIEYAIKGEQQLPHYDLIFNAIGDADTASRSRDAVNWFLALNNKPVLNPPQAIERTARDRIGVLLDGIENIHIPPVIRWDRRQADTNTDTLNAAAATAALSYPIIVRPAGAHGGDGVVLVHTPQEMAAVSAAAMAADADTTADELYLSSYCEYRSSDGFYRKYRVIFVDRKPYPYHLAISSQWLAHYVTADMLSLRWKLAEEYMFLNDPVSALSGAAWQALEAMGQRLDLDFGGVDFSLLPDGKLLLFEANATMLVHPEAYNTELKFKNVFVQRILDAFDQLLDRRIGGT
ncbi:MAG TPA: tetratricopeptide repeat protein [Herbaspirillum sp.]|nr:tetratricopeptide repeat protein [Herbaspirillum sp.]